MLPRRVLNDLPHTFSLALRTRHETQDNVAEVLQIFPHKGVWLSLEKTAVNVRLLLRKKKVEQQKVHLVDPLSRVIGSLVDVEGVTHVPYNMGHMLEAVEARVQELPLKERFVVVDGVHALPLVYDAAEVASFLRLLDKRLKVHHAKIVYTYREDKVPKEVMEVVHQLADKVVQVS